jgi:hypothetical protein
MGGEKKERTQCMIFINTLYENAGFTGNGKKTGFVN